VPARPSAPVGTSRHAGYFLSIAHSIQPGIDASDIWMKKPAWSMLSVRGAVSTIGTPARWPIRSPRRPSAGQSAGHGDLHEICLKSCAAATVIAQVRAMCAVIRTSAK
jgi:hypothetical protein